MPGSTSDFLRPTYYIGKFASRRLPPAIADRTMVGYKELASMDPVSDPSLVTTRWRDLGEPEGALLGVQYNVFSAADCL